MNDLITYSDDFLAFCQNASNQQLENILRDEYKASKCNPDREPDYRAALIEAKRRGWTVRRGERV